MKELIAQARDYTDQSDAWQFRQKLADALERLTAENDGHKISITCYQAQVDDLTAERDALAKDAERVRVYKQRYFGVSADAERYRFLRNGECLVDRNVVENEWPYSLKSDEELDAAIDAAIGKKK